MSKDEWKITYSGFLEKKNLLSIWSYCWVVLENSKLFIYSNETENNLKYKMIINENTIVEATQESSRTYTFCIRSNLINPNNIHNNNNSHNNNNKSNESNDSIFIFASADFSSLEAWMIALIQCINGSYRKSENFCSGSSSDTRLSLILPSSGGMCEKFSRVVNYNNPHFEKCGYLFKQGSEIKNWKRRWFKLKSNHFRYYEYENENLKGFRFIDEDSKVVILPSGFDGQDYGFCLLTYDSLHNQYNKLRLSTETENEMYDWILALKYSVQCYRDDNFSIPIIEDEEVDHENNDNNNNNNNNNNDNLDDSFHAGRFRLKSEDNLDLSSHSLLPQTYHHNPFETESSIGTTFFNNSNKSNNNNSNNNNFDNSMRMTTTTSTITTFTITGGITYIGSPLISVSPEESLKALEEDKEEKKPVSFYINDETIWAKIARKFSSPKVVHSPTDYNLQRLYLIHFCALVPRSNYILVEVFEHQRYIPLKGWSCLHLLFNDCAKLANCIGVKFPDRYLRRADPPLDYSWLEEKDLSEYDIDFINYGIYTPWKWTVCRAFTPDGEKAWAYGTSFDDIRRKYQDPNLRVQSHTNKRSVDTVRRRRWIRIAVENNPS